MKLFQRAHVVIVADDAAAALLAARLRRMQVMRVTTVSGVEEARLLCMTVGADVCVVSFKDALPDEFPAAPPVAPGGKAGVPSLMLAGVLTPFLRKAARRAGYWAAVPASIAPRLLYRRIGAALQRRSANRRAPRTIRMAVPGPKSFELSGFGKRTLH